MESYAELILKRIHIRKDLAVSRRFLMLCNSIDESIDYAADSFIYSMNLWVMGHESTVKVPADWWQALKERWFPQWLLERYPVVMREICVRHLYPNIDNSQPRLVMPVRIEEEDHE